MLEYHAAYYPIEDGWHMAVVLDFPGAASQGRTLNSARRMLRDSLQGLAEWLIEEGQGLPRPDPRAKDAKAEHQEAILLKIRALARASDETATASRPSASERLHRGARRGQAHHRL